MSVSACKHKLVCLYLFIHLELYITLAIDIRDSTGTVIYAVTISGLGPRRRGAMRKRHARAAYTWQRSAQCTPVTACMHVNTASSAARTASYVTAHRASPPYNTHACNRPYRILAICTASHTGCCLKGFVLRYNSSLYNSVTDPGGAQGTWPPLPKL